MNNVKEEILFSHTLPSANFYDMKRCARRGCIKPLSEFNVSKQKPDGRQPYCRACQDDDRLLRRYHITRQQRDLMYEQQQGQCASCHTFAPQLYIYAFEGLGVISLVCLRCSRICNGFNHNPDIITSAIAYLDYFGSRVLYGVVLHTTEDWEASATGKLPRKTRHRQYGGLVNEETYEHWLLLNEHTCYICWEPRSTGRKFARDHKHITDRNRALLCFLCNTTLGTAKEDTDLLRACARFLTSYFAPYLARLVQITDDMVTDAEQELPWVSRAYSAVLPPPQML
jgi:hypothetical protein